MAASDRITPILDAGALRSLAACPGCGASKTSIGAFHRCPGYPYVGPVPAPSRPFGVGLLLSSVALLLVALVQAWLSVQRADLDRRRADGADSTSAITHNVAAIRVLGVLTLGGVVAVVVLYLLWRQRRRPIQTLASWGETCVETPMRQVTPRWIRVCVAALVLAFLVTLVDSVVPADAPPTSLATYRMWSVANRLTLALLWLLVLVLVVVSDRHLGRRIARSAAARADPASVGYVVTLVPRDQRRVSARFPALAMRPGWPEPPHQPPPDAPPGPRTGFS